MKELNSEIMESVVAEQGAVAQEFTDLQLVGDYICPADKANAGWMAEIFTVQPDRKRDTYTPYYALAKVLKPTSIISMGVRSGLDTIAICKGLMAAGVKLDKVRWTGYDNEAWLKDSNTIAAKCFKRLGLDDFTFYKVDTTHDELPEPAYKADLVIVDAAHFEVNDILLDLDTAWNWLATKRGFGGGGALLVDDYDFIQVVRDAVDSFAKSKGITVNHIDSLRGLVLLQKP